MAAKTPRRASRCLAFQVLYGQEFIACASERDLRRAFMAAPRQDGKSGPDEAADAEQVVDEFAWSLVRGVWTHLDALDASIRTHAKNWRLERVGRVELTLLRLAVFEMLHCSDIPPRVSINEALELNRLFGEEKSKSFLNGILDAVSKQAERQRTAKE